MKTDFYPETRELQASMSSAAAAEFEASNLDHLRTLIRLTVEFFHFLNDSNASGDLDDLTYLCDSIIAGVDSFYDVNCVYRLLPNSKRSSADWGVASSMQSLKEEFNRKYNEFSTATALEDRCRLLLDLFKLQVAFVGISYP